MSAVRPGRAVKTVSGVLAALVVLPAVLAGCATAAPDTSTSTPASVHDAAASASFTACLREQGFDVEDPTGTAAGSEQVTIPDGADPAAYGRAVEECAARSAPDGAAEPAEEFRPSARQREAFGTCMRERGLPDFPDDEHGQQTYVPSDEGAFLDSSAACSEEAYGLRTEVAP
ncbi:hypothetical protein [Curtobacterium caseinilyticum]|uniref:Secreted protein n=1 Tax=Curtobacterium caseinilyticum TaxID=3055137 RepID=A0ABT7TQZ3_9MICO|nr:hypothetical protein [Curtobacterium caseinilyticum]MDM7892010.1 hypothetical protein [Curtobacterium caseinilyticum]